MPRDKILHILLGLGVTLGSGALLLWLSDDSVMAIIHAFALSILAGIGKEVWDASGNGVVDPWDFWATVGGGAFAVPVLVIMSAII